MRRTLRSLVDRLSIEAMRLIGVREIAERWSRRGPTAWGILDFFVPTVPRMDNGPQLIPDFRLGI